VTLRKDLVVTFARDQEPPTKHLGRWRMYCEGAVPIFLLRVLNQDGEAVLADEPPVDAICAALREHGGGGWDRRASPSGNVQIVAWTDAAAVVLSAWVFEVAVDRSERRRA
jgi:hypothetical protein